MSEFSELTGKTLCGAINMTEATRRLRILRAAHRKLIAEADQP